MRANEKKKIGWWLKRASVLAVLILPLALIGFRLNLYGFPIASKLLGLSLLLALTVLVFSIVVFLKNRNSSPQNSKQAIAAFFISLIPVLFLGSQIIKAKSLPMIHNISTDVVNPPEFNKIIELRAPENNSYVYDTSVLASVQQAAYPEIKTLFVDASLQQTYEKSLKVINTLGWDVVNQDPKNGIIEASQTSLLWGFTDDVVVRLTVSNGKTAIDLRSVSRIGRSDLGKNAERIDDFFDSFVK